MAEVTPQFPVEVSNAYNAWDFGAPYKDVISEGVVGATDLAVTQRGAGANNSVDIAAGTCWVYGDDNATQQPTYRCYNNAARNLVLTQDATNPRIALVVAHAYDAHFSGATFTWALEAILGTPAVSPVAPALPNNCLLLATVTVPATGGNVTNAQITDNRLTAKVGGGNASVAASIDGWTSIASTLTFGVADGHTFTATYAGDLTAAIPVGARIRLTHAATVKYFIVTAHVAGTLTLYGGTNYALAATAITAPSYSLAKAPVGFPLDPIKWTEVLKDVTGRSSVPTGGVWYNLASLSLDVPIGAWELYYETGLNPEPSSNVAGTTSWDIYTSLSTSNSGESDNEFTAGFEYWVYTSNGGAAAGVGGFFSRRKRVLLAAKTTYYLIEKWAANINANVGTVFMFNASWPTTIRAVCAYL